MISTEKPGTPEELVHFGVKGMRWGIRKEEVTSGQQSAKQPWSTKKKVAVGAGVAAVVLAGAYGAYKLHDSRTKELSEIGTKAIGISFIRKDALARTMTSDQIMKEIVPQINPGHGKIPGSSNNCLRCSFAYELRRRGFNVKATRTLLGRDQSPVAMIQALSGAGYRDRLINSGLGEHFIRISGDSLTRSHRIFDTLAKQPKGARGELGVMWSFGGAHSMSWEKIGDKIHIFDTQKNLHFSSAEEFVKFSQYIRDAGFTRLDNIDLDEGFLSEWIANVG